MKKFLTGTLLAILTVILCVALSACGKNYVGTYKFAKMEMSSEGMNMTYEAGKEVGGVTITEDAYVLEVKEDGTFTMAVNMMGESGTQNGTWTEEDGKLALNIEGEVQYATLSGGQLIMTETQQGMSIEIVFNKN